MKSLAKSSLWVASLLLVGNLFLSSCDKDKDDPEKASVPLIATATHYDESGELRYSESYQYDNQGRMIKMDDNNNYHVTMEYVGSTVIVKDYEGSELSETNTIQLNSKGLGISITTEESEDISTYEYDGNGYRKSTIHQDGSGVSTMTYTVLEGNFVTSILTDQSVTENSAVALNAAFLKRSSLIANLRTGIISENSLKSATETHISKVDYQFYLDKINTIEFENMGITFMGKQNKNLIKQETSSSTYDGEVFGPSTNTYTYEYDAKGRITKRTSSHGDYLVYTYVD